MLVWVCFPAFVVNSTFSHHWFYDGWGLWNLSYFVFRPIIWSVIFWLLRIEIMITFVENTDLFIFSFFCWHSSSSFLFLFSKPHLFHSKYVLACQDQDHYHHLLWQAHLRLKNKTHFKHNTNSVISTIKALLTYLTNMFLIVYFATST